MHLVAISCYTPEYADFASTLRASLDRMEIPNLVMPYVSQGDWVANCAYKATFICHTLHKLKCPVLWIDADAEVLKPIDPFDFAGVDFSARFRQGKLAEKCGPIMSGTLFFGNNVRSRGLARSWVDECQACPNDWDQVCLWRCWCSMRDGSGIGTWSLPETMCHKIEERTDETVIVHYMGSRTLKQAVQAASHGQARQERTASQPHGSATTQRHTEAVPQSS